MGNLFIFLLAGHETTAHSLAFLFTILALYPEHQQILFEEADAVYGAGGGDYQDYGKFVRSLFPSLAATR